MKELVPVFLLAIFSLACAHEDLFTRKIPNRLNLAGAACGCLVSTVLFGADGLSLSLKGMLAGFGVLLVPFLLHLVGAGDLKFLAASGAFCGWAPVAAGFLGGTAIATTVCVAGFDSNRAFAAMNGIAGIENVPARETLPYTVPLAAAVLTAFTAQTLGAIC